MEMKLASDGLLNKRLTRKVLSTLCSLHVRKEIQTHLHQLTRGILSEAAPAKKPSTVSNTDGFTADSIPPHHFHIGEDNYAVVSDFGDVINVHIRKFRTDENGRIFPTKTGVSFSPYVWESLVTEMENSSLPSDTGKVVIVRDILFLSTA
ncbi:hypothetical protein AVEN_72495-1 [Araneus ventricosus]|uniref:Transcriptional coactivator p15 (PC4) C-terminal domain-containing protein n=1 Tax=Araneus ventricosus TaxID=182803 RepID=A0A4Y2G6I4_ARAVE|nr:hypothetical protein AVEN_72495-1 [Araneus ventricosus]